MSSLAGIALSSHARRISICSSVQHPAAASFPPDGSTECTRKKGLFNSLLPLLPLLQELMGAATEQPQRRLPRGTSEYQAAWIVDDEGDEDEFDTAVAAPSEAAPASHAATDAMSQLEDEDDAMGEGLGSEACPAPATVHKQSNLC